MDLSDRGRRERRLLELNEEPLDRLVELLLDRSLDVRERKWTDVVLQAAQLGDDVRRDNIRARGEELPELDEGRPQLVEHVAEVPPPRRPVDRGVGPAPPLERVTEAVPDGHLCDLAQPAEVALLGTRGHRLSVRRASRYS